MHQALVTIDFAQVTNAPQWWRAPLAPTRISDRAMIGETFTHVVQQEVGVGRDGLVTELGVRVVRRRLERRHMTPLAPSFSE